MVLVSVIITVLGSVLTSAADPSTAEPPPAKAAVGAAVKSVSLRPSSFEPTQTAEAPPSTQPAPPPPRFEPESGCNRNVWGPAFSRSGFTPGQLGVSECLVHPSYTLSLPAHGRVCGYFDPNDRSLHVDVRTLEGGCRGRPSDFVLLHEIGHAWHTSDGALDEWARSVGVEAVAECFSAAFLGPHSGCPAWLGPEVTARLSR